jgi:hypothetical protein
MMARQGSDLEFPAQFTTKKVLNEKVFNFFLSVQNG